MTTDTPKRPDEPTNEQLGQGTWAVHVGSAIVAYAWRPSGTGNEVFACGSSTRPWPFASNHRYELTGASHADEAAFLAWVCQQIGGGTVYYTRYTISSADATHSCA